MNSLQGKIILVTGATGFIGSHLANRLAQIPEIKLILMSRNEQPKSEQNLIWVTSSLDQLTQQTWSDLGVEQIDVVFHLGAFTPKTSGTGDAVDEIYADNLQGTRVLLESLPSIPDKIIFSSTLDVYAPPEEGCVLIEESPLEPTSLYGASKLFCESLIKSYGRKHNCGYAILRYGHIYGPGEGAYTKLIPQSIKALLNNNSPIIYGDGSVLRDFMFVGDAVEATIRAAISNQRKIDPVNIVSGNSKSIRDFVEKISEIVGSSCGIKYLLDKAGGRFMVFSNSRMIAVLGQWDLLPLEEGLRLEINYFKEMQ